MGDSISVKSVDVPLTQKASTCQSETKRNGENMHTKSGTRFDYYNRMHEKHLPSFKNLSMRIIKGLLKIVDIRIDEPQFGHTRVTIFLHDTEE
jgi:hypothetical protein